MTSRAVSTVLLLATMLVVAGCGLSVRRYTTTSLTNTRADEILKSSWSILDTIDGANDVACNVNTLWQGRRDDVTAFTTGNGIINSVADQNVVVGSFVTVVNQINFCTKISPNIVGCAPIPGKWMLVVRLPSSLAGMEGILWAHEYGHTRGLNHRSDSDAVMSSGGLDVTNLKVNATECGQFKK